MANLDVDLKFKTVNWQGKPTFWWKVKHKRSTSSEEASDRRIWYRKSKKHGYRTDSDGNILDKTKRTLTELKRLAASERTIYEPYFWEPAKHKITTRETLNTLNTFVDEAEEKRQKKVEAERQKQEPEKRRAATQKETKIGAHQEGEGIPSTKSPSSFQRLSKDKMKSGKFVWQRKDDGAWLRIISIDPLQWEFVPQKDWATLDNIFSKLPVPDKYPDVPSKRKRPKFAERNKHGGIIIHSFADDRYYTRFDIRKSKKHPGGFTFRMGRGKFYIQETMDEEGLAAIAREISFVRHS